jgi:hypothetical protein
MNCLTCGKPVERVELWFRCECGDHRHVDEVIAILQLAMPEDPRKRATTEVKPQDSFPHKLRELLDDDSDAMTAWEVEFIESVHEQSERPEWTPSLKQVLVLNKIWDKVFK